MHLNARVPVTELDGVVLVFVVGEQEAALGEMVSVTETRTKRTFRDKFVSEVMSCQADEFQLDYLKELGFSSLEAFVGTLSVCYGTALPETVEVTLYTLSDKPPVFIEDATEEEEEFEEDEKEYEDKGISRWLK